MRKIKINEFKRLAFSNNHISLFQNVLSNPFTKPITNCHISNNQILISKVIENIYAI